MKWDPHTNNVTGSFATVRPKMLPHFANRLVVAVLFLYMPFSLSIDEVSAETKGKREFRRRADLP